MNDDNGEGNPGHVMEKGNSPVKIDQEEENEEKGRKEEEEKEDVEWKA